MLFTNDALFALWSFLAFLVDKNQVKKAVGWRKRGMKLCIKTFTRYSDMRLLIWTKNSRLLQSKKRPFNQLLLLKYTPTRITMILLIGCVQAHTSTASCSWGPQASSQPSWFWIITTDWRTLTRCQAGWVFNEHRRGNFGCAGQICSLCSYIIRNVSIGKLANSYGCSCSGIVSLSIYQNLI